MTFDIETLLRVYMKFDIEFKQKSDYLTFENDEFK